MNNQEAIETLKANYPDACYEQLREAVDVAISAIQAQEALQPTCNNLATDTIYRQAAIDALHMHLMYRMGTDSNKKRLDEWINNLPSAQPEIIRCRDCKYAEVADKEDMQDGYTCQFHRGSIWFSGSYCSWAERITDD